VSGLKFRRQHPVGRYFADFACIEIGLIVELDGGQHADESNITGDRQRSDELCSSGFRVLRFWNSQVLTETEAVLQEIWRTAEALTPALSRQRERE
jgi:very-short-patch-repair endonuclease